MFRYVQPVAIFCYLSTFHDRNLGISEEEQRVGIEILKQFPFCSHLLFIFIILIDG